MKDLHHQLDGNIVGEFRNEVTKLIEFNYLREAKEFIRQYENLSVPKDELESAKGIIHMLEGDSDNAHASFLSGIHFNPINYELYYNAGYLFESQNDYLGAYRNYKKAYEISHDSMILEKMNSIAELKVVKEYQERKKVLILAHIFPPSGGSGVQRTLKFVKYLRDFGWEPIVVTTANHSGILYDETFLKEIPEGIEIIRINEHVKVDKEYINQLIDFIGGVIRNKSLIEQYVNILSRTKSMDELSRLLKMPDNAIYFAKESVGKICEMVDLNDVDMFYSTSGPYSDHIIAYYLKNKFNKPWIADFRDEWTNNSYIESDVNNLFYQINYEMEKNILHSCDKVLTTTPIASENYISEFKLDENKVITLTNGFDEEDFQNNRPTETNKKFRITHNGIFYMIRTPETILKAINNLIQKNKVDTDRIEVVFTVTSDEDRWMEMVSELNLSNIVDFKGYLDHQTSIQLCKNSDILLLVVGPGEKNKNVYPGKIFEYLRLGKRILSLSPSGSLCEHLIEEYKTGKNVDFHDVDGIEEYIYKCYLKWNQADLPDIIQNSEISKYNRRNLTNKLVEIFDHTSNYFQKRKLDLNERDPQFYNDLYKRGGWNNTYYKHYAKTHYFEIWNAAVKKILGHDNPNVIDIGCGPGQFANMLFDHQITEYSGIDFSEKAIENARALNKNHANLFKVDNAYTSDIFNQDYGLAVIFEVLEHIDHDIEVINKIKKGKTILFSVPNFYSPGHVRWFNSKLEVLNRYTDYVTINEILSFNVGGANKIYLVNGIKK